MEKPAVATFWVALEKSDFLSLVSRLPEGSENGSPILGASPTFGGTPQMRWHKLEMGPSKRKSWLLPREESISFHVYLPWTTDQNSDHRSGWLDGQEYHKPGRTSGFGGEEGEIQFHQSTQEEIPRAENTSADNTESHRELLRPSEWMDAKREACWESGGGQNQCWNFREEEGATEEGQEGLGNQGRLKSQKL